LLSAATKSAAALGFSVTTMVCNKIESSSSSRKMVPREGDCGGVRLGIDLTSCVFVMTLGFGRLVALLPSILAAAVFWVLPIGDLGADRTAMAARDYFSPDT
jgi:hypothetical protein